VVSGLRAGGNVDAGQIRNVGLLGHKGKVKWTHDGSGFKVEMPEDKPSDHAVALKIALA
jgi:alpha-L-fucosidase